MSRIGVDVCVGVCVCGCVCRGVGVRDMQRLCTTVTDEKKIPQSVGLQ